jgi:hypothetical protein
MKRYLPLLAYLVTIISCTYVAYKSGKDDGSKEAMNFSPVLSSGTRYEVYCNLYEGSKIIMNDETKKLLQFQIKHARSEYIKQWEHIENESYFPKYKGLISRVNHNLDKEFK